MITKSAEYALRAVAFLADKPGMALPADAIALKTKIPRRYLHRILQALVAKGIVHSRLGPGGGYDLVEDSKNLSLLDVVNSVSPIERIRKCPLGLSSHHTLCPLHAEIDRVCESMEKAFSRVSVKALLMSRKGPTPLCNIGKKAEKSIQG